MSKHITNLINELRNNTRLRLGIWLIIILFFSYSLMLLNDYKLKTKQEYEKNIARLSQLHSIANQTKWTERANEIQKVRKLAQTKLWKANTKGLAQATFQQWLRTISKEMDIKRLQVDPAFDVRGYIDIWQVTAKLRGNLTNKELTSLLQKLANHKTFVVIEMLDVHEVKEQLRFVMIVKAYFQKDSSSII